MNRTVQVLVAIAVLLILLHLAGAINLTTWH